MSIHDNAYFQKMYEVCCDYAEIQMEHESKKAGILEQFGWDSIEITDWYEKDQEIKDACPYTRGQMQAYWAYDRNEAEELEFSDYCWEKDIHDFITTLREAGIESFICTNRSTALMENIHGFIHEGCTLEGACTLTKESHMWGQGEYEELGLRFKIN